MAKDPTELIHCDNCGEDYAAAYRRCPFCNAKPGKKSPVPPVYDDFSDDFLLDEDLFDQPTPAPEDPRYDTGDFSTHPGGKRLVTNRRGGGYGGGVSIGRIIGYIVTALILGTAIWLVLTQLLPRLLPSTPEPTPTPPAVVTPTPTPVVTPTPEVSTAPDDTYTEPLPDVSGVPQGDVPATQTPLPSASAAPSQVPTGDALKLSSEDFTLSSRYPTYQMEISGVGRAQATYVIADETIASVTSTGYITAKKNGVTKLTVTANDGRSATAIVRVSGFTSSAAESPQPSDSSVSGGSAKLSSTDFTLSSTNGKSYRLTVSGGTANYWTSSNEAVATVSANGTVTAVSKGTAKITCGLSDGTTLTCIVRVN